MCGHRGSHNAEADARVWVLGTAHLAADRSIKWDEDFGNLSDPDVLIVDLTTLTAEVLQRANKDKLDQAQTSIADKLFHGGVVVVITQPQIQTLSGDALAGRQDAQSWRARDYHIYSNYDILPAIIGTRKVPTGYEIRAVDGHTFKDYIDAIESFDFLISMDGDNLPLGPTGARQAVLYRVQEWDITDNSGHHLGFALAGAKLDRYGRLPGDPSPGRMILLPPPTEPIGRAIGRILSVCKNAPAPAEAPPAWAERLSPGPARKHQARIAELEGCKAEIQGEIDGLVSQYDVIMAHCRLLYSDGPELEDAVVQAFRALGFSDIKQMGNADEEDAAFAMDGTSYSRGVIEAKGADRGIQKRDILQCRGWAARRAAADGRPMKGILVPNQHRLKPYPKSSKIRIKIEPNQVEQAEADDVCIIPSCVLFEAVSKVLDGETPDRARIADRIADTKGVLKDVL